MICSNRSKKEIIEMIMVTCPTSEYYANKCFERIFGVVE
jgi:hypothetical protein